MSAGRFVHEITSADVGRAFVSIEGRHYSVRDFMGRILPGDVGKRIFLVDGVLQVENDGQRASRRGLRAGARAPEYGAIVDGALPYGATARDYLELALASLDQINVPLDDVLAALPPNVRTIALGITWVKKRAS